MKTKIGIITVILAGLVLTSCGTPTPEEMKKEVCDCFKSNEGMSRMKCLKLQDSYSKELQGEASEKFLMETNDCMSNE